MKQLRIFLSVISFIIGIIIILSVTGKQAAYLGSFCMLISISFLYYARKQELEKIKKT